MGDDEKVLVYNFDNPSKGKPFSRNRFYNSQIEVFQKTGKPSLAVEVVGIFIFNEHGELYVQMRADSKRHNPNLFDKSIGGHIKYGDTPDYTVMVETVQELQVPSVVLRTDEDFRKTLGLLRDYLDTVAIIKHIDTKLIKLKKVIDGVEIKIANKVNLYFGVYGGRVKAVDREAKGVLIYSIADLRKEMSKHSDNFTDDLHQFISRYEREIKDFLEAVRGTINKN